MPTDVVMPQMGESIAEGTIVRWIKKVGDQVARDEPLFEISTDKVDAEIPSPAAGVLTEIRVKEGETVPVNSVVAVIGQAGEPASKAPTPADPRSRRSLRPRKPPRPPPGGLPRQQPTAPQAVGPPRASQRRLDTAPASAAAQTVLRRNSARRAPAVRRSRGAHPPALVAAGPQDREGPQRRHLSNPRHRHRRPRDEARHPRLHRATGAQAAAGGSAPAPTAAPQQAPRQPRAAAPAAPPPRGSGVPGQVQPMSVMRKKIAEHMVMSRRTSAHVHSVFEVNFSRVAQIREAKKAEYEKAGAKLTYLSFIIKAVVDALRAVPVVNASIDGDNIVYHRDVNLGIAVALDWGLIVPVIKKADELNLLGLSRAVADLAARARTKQLKPDEVTGGTFTITNPGVFGALFGMPIINQPQVAILGVGHIEKRPVVIDDAIAIRPMAYLTLGYDHRLIDGAVADQFMSHVKHKLENWDPTQA